MTRRELRRWLETRKMTQVALASHLGVHRVTVATWLTGKYPIPKWVALALGGLDNQQGRTK